MDEEKSESSGKKQQFVWEGPTSGSDESDSSTEFVDEEKEKRKQHAVADRCRKKARTHENEEKTVATCSICAGVWHSSGEHRICSLRCGHLYGLKCIRQWLKHLGRSSCPECKKPARPGDIRVLYTSKISVLDVTERDSALKALKEQTHIRKKLEKGLKLLQENYRRLLADHQQLTSAIQGSFDRPAGALFHKQAILQGDVDHLTARKTPFEMATPKAVQSSRVMDFNKVDKTLVFSENRSATLGGEFGLTQLSLLDPRHTVHIRAHSQAIRDVHCRSSGEPLLLSCSTDKSTKVSDLRCGQVILSFDCVAPVWSCSWMASSSQHLLFSGLVNGGLVVFDMRKPGGPMRDLPSPFKRPLHSVCLLSETSSHLNVVVAGLGCLSTLTIDHACVEDPLWATEMDGRCCADVCVSQTCLLVSRRPEPGLNIPARASLYRLPNLQPYVDVFGHTNATVLSRCAVYDEGERCCIIAGDDAFCRPQYWICNNSPNATFQGSLQRHRKPVLDLKACPDLGLLGALSEDQLFIYKARSL